MLSIRMLTSRRRGCVPKPGVVADVNLPLKGINFTWGDINATRIRLNSMTNLSGERAHNDNLHNWVGTRSRCRLSPTLSMKKIRSVTVVRQLSALITCRVSTVFTRFEDMCTNTASVHDLTSPLETSAVVLAGTAVTVFLRLQYERSRTCRHVRVQE